MPDLLIEDGDDLIVREWRNLSHFCTNIYDGPLMYLLELAEDAPDPKKQAKIDPDVIRGALGRIPDDLLRKLCRQHSVAFVPANDSNFTKMIGLLSAKEAVVLGIIESLQGGSGVSEILRDRIDRYVDKNWRFTISECYLRVPKDGEHYDIDAKVALCITRRAMMEQIENFIEDPKGENGDYNDLPKLVGENGDRWDTVDQDAIQEDRGQWSDDPLADKDGDLVFGSKKNPKMSINDSGDILSLARSYTDYLRGNQSSFIPSNTNDMFDSVMRRYLNILTERK